MSIVPGELRRLVAKLWSHLWPLYLLSRQLTRAAGQASGITITIVVGVYPFISDRIKRAADDSILSAALRVFALFVILTLVSGAIALLTADPETYARVLIAGRPPKEVLFTISSRIAKACSRTLRLSTWAERLLEPVEERTRPDDDREDRQQLPAGRWRRAADSSIRIASLAVYRPWRGLRRGYFPPLREDAGKNALERDEQIEVNCLVWWLRRYPRKQHASLQRIDAMKRLASQELDIPPRRLCDHLFQYSPAMHRDRLQKYVQSWEEILDLQSGSADSGRLRSLAVQNLSFINNVRRRSGFQRQILDNRDLHSYIVQFASLHSTSGSLQTYADALRMVAMKGESSLRRTRGKARQCESERIRERLELLSRKQRAHPGFDLHKLLLRALAAMHYPELAGAKSVLLELQGARQGPLQDANPSAQEPVQPPRSEEKGKSPVSEKQLESFRFLSSRLADHVAASRETISEKFEEICLSWFHDAQGFRYIVSHGYSRTVLAVLKRSLTSKRAAGNSLFQEQLTRLFFMLPDLADEKQGLDTRILEYEIKEDRKLRRFRNLAAGTPAHLLGLLGAQDRVLVLLGAECFDTDRRMVHPRGFGRDLRDLLDEMTQRGIPALVLVVSESYKLHDEGSLTADTHFYGQHFDRIDLYPPDCIHLVADSGTIRPEAWQRQLERRRRAARRARVFVSPRAPAAPV